MKVRIGKSSLLGVFLLALSMPLAAGAGGAMRDIGEFTVHYNAMPASSLDQAVAERHGLPRSDKRCVVTVAVIHDESGAMVSADIMASATRRDGRMYKIDLRPITDAGGMYYVGELPLDLPATLDFVLEVQPEQDMPPQTIRFRRELTAP